MRKQHSSAGGAAAKAGRAFARARSGNVAMIWALVGAVLIGMVGLTVDFARAQAIRARLQNAADGAALVAERASHLPLARREEMARAFFNTEAGEYGPTSNMIVSELESGGHRVDASYVMITGLAKVVKDEDWTIRVAAEAEAQASPPIEVVLALDNTGSMSGDMQTLRDGAEELVNYLLSIDGDTVKVGLVPFVAQVNIGADNISMTDTDGLATFNGEIFEDRQIGWIQWNSAYSTNGTSTPRNCDVLNNPAATSNPTLPYSSYTGPYRITWVYRHANQANSRRCLAYTPNVIDYHDLYPSDSPWKGCVEARPEPYDISDDPPSTSTPETLFTPYFWVDGEDTNYYPNQNLQPRFNNSNLSFTMGYTPNDTGSTSTTRADTFNVFKYRGQASSPAITNAAPSSTGPNKGCPTPIVPLTSNRATVVDAVRDMEHWNGGGTNQVEGLVWAWRVLSPGEPFTQGVDYGFEDTRKVVVLMTDGQNTNLDDSTVMESDYSAWNHLGLWRTYDAGVTVNHGTGASPASTVHGALPSGSRRDIDDTDEFVERINEREELLCEAMKAEPHNIEIYTIIFRESDGTAQDILRNCATDDDHYFRADNAEELLQAFTAIGSGIGQLRITR